MLLTGHIESFGRERDVFGNGVTNLVIPQNYQHGMLKTVLQYLLHKVPRNTLQIACIYI